MSITLAQLKELTPTGKPAIHAEIIKGFDEYAEKFGLTSPLRKAHFLAQIAHESAHFSTTTEFASGDAYDTRTDLGNTPEKDGDGRLYKGRGLIQLTGKTNYTAFTRWARAAGLNPPDFVKEPLKAADFPWAFISGLWYWESRKLNALADGDNIVAITKKINGGTNGLEDRKNYYAKARKIFGLEKAVIAPPAPVSTPKPAQKPAVAAPAAPKVSTKDVQLRLIAIGYRIEATGVFDDKTKAAVRVFQKFNGLNPDGIVGNATLGALFK